MTMIFRRLTAADYVRMLERFPDAHGRHLRGYFGRVNLDGFATLQAARDAVRFESVFRGWADATREAAIYGMELAAEEEA